MLNFSRTPTRLDTSPSPQKMQSIFCKFWIVGFAIYALLLLLSTVGTAKENQAYTLSCSHSANTSLLQERKIHDNLVDKCLTEFMEASIISETFPITQEPLAKNASRIPMYLYLHLENNLSSKFHWVPIVLEEKASKTDIAVDLSLAVNPDLSYELSAYHQHIVNLLVYREAGNQPFLGQLLVAEDIIGRIRSGVYGPDVDAILMLYLAQNGDDGKLHVYDSGGEVTEATPSVKEAVELALSGSQVSYFLLQSVTELRNNQYSLHLDDTYYKWGAMYHFNPDIIDSSSVKSRNINRVPVSFQYCEHIFYGYWLPKSAQLNL